MLMDCQSRDDNGTDEDVRNRCARQEDFAGVKCFSGEYVLRCDFDRIFCMTRS